MPCFSMNQPGVRKLCWPQLYHCPSLGGDRPSATSAPCFRGAFKWCKKGVQQTSVRRIFLEGIFPKPCWLQVYCCSEFCWFTNLPKLLHETLGFICSLDRVPQTPLVTRLDERHVSLDLFFWGRVNFLLHFYIFLKCRIKKDFRKA